ncbi:hypothetical protein TTHERM_00621170 (macronuclear) [Tetrahymena thermophila SB210]|uniref:Uncharacterized protein n=1 Tax=Tetrahymena thermophila (strain SB210) TaxID=312017 RepID=Q23ME2_TETTS|nr:hypothetical protein TTHERM_00621170 [Tetrahymena thermophila SB210]EAR97697.3 hypothetical protein TTHERM_00621170 [Tetrahymena thermophila SB210]|eukprot:XP_001017942.3 hypothetical protein TTHERM_00621170 [Tetrahymena thermophila SB210]
MNQASSKYQFETIDQLGVKQVVPPSNYYRLDRTVPIQNVPLNQQSGYASNVRTLDYLQAASNLNIHRAYENDNILTKVPTLQINGSYKKTLLNRTRELVEQNDLSSPFKQYTQRLSSPTHHQSPIYSGSLPQYQSNQSPQMPRNIDEQSLYYYRAGDAVPPPLMSQFQQLPSHSQLVSCQTYVNPNLLNHSALHNQQQNFIDPGKQQMMDIYSELPRDQCHYCVSNTGLFGTQPADYYYNKQLIEERENMHQIQQKQYMESIKQQKDGNKKDWENEIDERRKKNKNQDDIRDNVSVESDITKNPQDYAMNIQDMGIPDGKEINEHMNKEKQKAQAQFGGMLKATMFGKKLKNVAEQSILKRQVNEVNELFEQQEQDFINFENIQFADLDHLTDEEKKKLLLYYSQMNMLNEEMKNGQVNSQKSLSQIISFVQNQISGIQEQVFANGLDNLAKRLQRE